MPMPLLQELIIEIDPKEIHTAPSLAAFEDAYRDMLRMRASTIGNSLKAAHYKYRGLFRYII